jgi:hypothetical protein
MLNRRACFAMPLLAAVPGWGAAALAGPIAGVSEVRLALPEGEAVRMGVRVRTSAAGAPGVVAALDRGHLEGAVLSPGQARAARALMGARLAALPPRADGRVPVVRRALPPGLHRAVADALAA